MKKKLFSMLLAAALTAGLLSGCGNKSEKETVDKAQTEVTEATEAETEKTLSADGITVTGLMGSAEKVELTAVTDGDDYKSVTDFVATLTDKNVTATEVYNIDLLDKFGVNAQPDGSVKISLTLSDDFVNAEGDGYEVYRKEDDNTFTKLTASVDKKEISFDTEHFSIYVVVKTNSAPVEETTEAPAEEAEPAADAQSPYSYTDKSATMYAQRNVNVRDLPDTNGNKVGGLSTNDEVTVTGQCNETGWYRINYNGGTAYVSNDLLGDSKVEGKVSNQENSSQSDAGSDVGADDSSNAQQAASDNGKQTEYGQTYTMTLQDVLNATPYPIGQAITTDEDNHIYYYFVMSHLRGQEGCGLEGETQARDIFASRGYDIGSISGPLTYVERYDNDNWEVVRVDLYVNN